MEWKQIVWAGALAALATANLPGMNAVETASANVCIYVYTAAAGGEPQCDPATGGDVIADEIIEATWVSTDVTSGDSKLAEVAAGVD